MDVVNELRERDMYSWVSPAWRWWSTEEDSMRWLNDAVYRMKGSGFKTEP